MSQTFSSIEDDHGTVFTQLWEITIESIELSDALKNESTCYVIAYSALSAVKTALEDDASFFEDHQPPELREVTSLRLIDTTVHVADDINLLHREAEDE